MAKDDESDSPASTPAALAAEMLSRNAAQASDTVRDGTQKVSEMVHRETGKLHSTHPRHAETLKKMGRGNVFETTTDLDLNEQLALKGSDARYQNTRLNKDHPNVRARAQASGTGANRLPEDSLRIENGVATGGRQDKFIELNENNLKALCNEKYDKLDIAVPSDDAQAWRDAFRKFAEKQTDPEMRDRANARAERVVEGASRQDTADAIKDSDWFGVRRETRAVVREAAVAAGAAAMMGGLIAGLTSAIRQGVAYNDGKVTLTQAVITVGKDTGTAAAASATQATAGVVVRTVASKAGQTALAKGAAPQVLVGLMFEVGQVMTGLVRGTMAPEEAMDRLGRTACTTIAGLYAGAAAATAFGSLGTFTLSIGVVAAPMSVPILLSSMATCMVVSAMHDSLIAFVRNARAEEAEALKAAAALKVATADLQRQREEFEAAFAEVFGQRQKAIGESFGLIYSGMNSADVDTTLAGMEILAELVGTSLRFRNFEEFDNFMQNDNTKLIL